ncbi:MAG TPA: 4Fe-4S dicluster domain-containing protein [Clostridia bacterium]|nr:4Fe-4S dicluster domain-containing protein [Clostridia bacterium]
MKEVFIRPERCVGCKSCEIACAVAHSSTKDLYSAVFEPDPPRKRVFACESGNVKIALQCRHCEEPLCVKVCPTQALIKDKASGLVVHREELCLGCGMCQIACPFGVISRRANSKIIAKCDLCPDLDSPACVEACPTKALFVDDSSDIANMKRKSLIKQLSLQNEISL